MICSFFNAVVSSCAAITSVSASISSKLNAFHDNSSISFDDELDKNDESNISSNSDESILKDSNLIKSDKIYINLKALDKITAKTSSFRIAIGDKKFFGPLEIKGLKCQLIEEKNLSDTIAYIQVKDLSKKDNNRVFLYSYNLYI